jgi:hypothetical protein
MMHQVLRQLSTGNSGIIISVFIIPGKMLLILHVAVGFLLWH